MSSRSPPPLDVSASPAARPPADRRPAIRPAGSTAHRTRCARRWPSTARCWSAASGCATPPRRRHVLAAADEPDDRAGGVRAPRSATRRACTARRSGRPTSRCACTTSSATPSTFPGLMLFACLTAPESGGATARGRRPDGARRAARRTWWRGSSARAGCSPAATTTRSARRGRGVRHRRPRRRRALLPRQRDRLLLAARRRAAHPAAPQRRRAPPRHRAALLVQPGRVPQPVDAGPRRARLPARRLRRRGAAVQHPLRQRRPDRRGRRGPAERGLRGAHGARAVAGGRPAAGRQHPHRAQPGALHR